MPLPTPARRAFGTVPPNPSRSDFHGPYNKLLCTLFSQPCSDFLVDWRRSCDESMEFIVTFQVGLENKTVFILTIRSPGDLASPSRRAAADRQMRECMLDVIDCPLPNLHTVSAMGTKLCFYSKSRDGRLAHRIPSDPDFVVDIAPRERWNYDVLEEEGVQKLQAIVEEIKGGCATL